MINIFLFLIFATLHLQTITKSFSAEPISGCYTYDQGVQGIPYPPQATVTPHSSIMTNAMLCSKGILILLDWVYVRPLLFFIFPRHFYSRVPKMVNAYTMSELLLRWNTMFSQLIRRDSFNIYRCSPRLSSSDGRLALSQ